MDKLLRKYKELNWTLFPLQTNRKIPIEKNWPACEGKYGPVELSKKLAEGKNLAVVLGHSSSFEDGSQLGVIDVDIIEKNQDSENLRKEILKLDFNKSHPRVITPRGGFHFYFRHKTPQIYGERSASKKLNLDGKPVWKIECWSQAHYAVVPPSIVNGNRYRWVNFPERYKDIPLKDFEKVRDDTLFPVLDLDRLVSSKATKDLIRKGVGMERYQNDRSRALLRACSDLVKLGLSDEIICNILTDKKYFLGRAVLDRRPVRAKAAEWVLKYEIKKAKETYEQTFPGIQPGELRVDEKNKVLKDESNVLILLRSLGDLFRFNALSCFIEFNCDSLWEPQKHKGDEVEDTDLTALRVHLQNNFYFNTSREVTAKALELSAKFNIVDPVKEYLDSLAWDGEKRIDTWIKRVFSCEDSEFTRQVSAKTLCGAVARTYVPGSKFDSMLVLQGEQGLGKSKVIDTLGSPWATSMLGNVKSKEALERLRGQWIVEVPELSAISANKVDIETVKAFITNLEDRYRVPWDRYARNFKRRCIFIGTTNEKEFLRDITGNRRFWPVTVRQLADFEWLEDNRDQLWAEAVVRYRQGEELYLTLDQRSVIKHVSEFEEENVLMQKVLAGLKEDNYPQYVKASEAYEKYVSNFNDRLAAPWEYRLVKKALEIALYKKVRLGDSGNRFYCYEYHGVREEDL